jgi:hypothetical protein
MSFDLYFCWHKREPVNLDSVADWSQKHRYFQRKDSQLFYSNEDTGVYFSLDFEIKDAEESVIPSDYFDSGLSFNLNFNRPSFFGYEAFPLVVDLCENFRLAVFDPQESDGQAVNHNPGIAELTNSWLRSNRNAVVTIKEYNKGFSISRMPLSTSRYLWSYSRKKQDLQAKLTDDIFVPTLFPFRRGGSESIETAVICTSEIPMIVPASEWVVIQRPKKRFLGIKEETEIGVVSASVFNSAVGDLIIPFTDWELSVRIINPESAGAAAKRLKSIQDMLPLKEFERVALDSFIDFEDDSPGRTVAEIIQ